ncbi:MAG: hypothetical protein RMH97_10490 [Verrucomicrobiales bacterium]|nr:hypothetical protein [Verrucomicrobiales bacterium]
MKTAQKFILMVVVAAPVLVLLSGCTEQRAGASQSDATGAVAATPPATNAMPAPSISPAALSPAGNQLQAATVTNEPAASADRTQSFEPPAKQSGEKPLPPNIFISPALRDVIKMAEAGVEESVLLSYISNSIRTFCIGADQLIYLNDIGVPESVVLAMLEQDKRLRLKATEPATAKPEPTVTATATAEPSPPQPPNQQYAATEGPREQTVINYNYFYNTLAPYGTWLWIEDYGWCWRPTIVVIHRGWHPYCHGGRWLYSNWGWYWYSDYTWGRIVFHYGRWFRHPRWGWCWWPDTVWAPAWVVWRYTDHYCGWAPLPPFTTFSAGVGVVYRGAAVGFDPDPDCYTYVSWTVFADRGLHRHRLPPDRAKHIHGQTVVVNNFINGDNNIVGNVGVPVERVARLAGREIPRAVVRDLPVEAAHNDDLRRPRREGDKLIVYRERLPGNGIHSRIGDRPDPQFDAVRFSPPLGQREGTPVRPLRTDFAPRQERPGTEAGPTDARPGPARAIGNEPPMRGWPGAVREKVGDNPREQAVRNRPVTDRRPETAPGPDAPGAGRPWHRLRSESSTSDRPGPGSTPGIIPPAPAESAEQPDRMLPNRAAQPLNGMLNKRTTESGAAQIAQPSRPVPQPGAVGVTGSAPDRPSAERTDRAVPRPTPRAENMPVGLHARTELLQRATPSVSETVARSVPRPERAEVTAPIPRSQQPPAQAVQVERRLSVPVPAPSAASGPVYSPAPRNTPGTDAASVVGARINQAPPPERHIAPPRADGPGLGPVRHPPILSERISRSGEGAAPARGPRSR